MVGWLEAVFPCITVLAPGQADRVLKYSHDRKKGSSAGSCTDIRCSDPEVTHITSAHNVLAKTSYMATPNYKEPRSSILSWVLRTAMEPH